MSILQPSVTHRSYYPTVNDIRNHMYKARIVLKFDQENLTLKIKEWEAFNSGDSHFFRPYIKGDNGKLQEHPCDYEVQLEQSLIWVYQQKWQKEAMTRYGNHISLIDATYRTMKYELPLFFICVRTNVGYSVVAQFIVQSESIDHLTD